MVSSAVAQFTTYYSYDDIGQLSRMELGKLRVQGLDYTYTYTLQGWLKGVNAAMGGSLSNGTDTVAYVRDASGNVSCVYNKNKNGWCNNLKLIYTVIIGWV